MACVFLCVLCFAGLFILLIGGLVFYFVFIRKKPGSLSTREAAETDAWTDNQTGDWDEGASGKTNQLPKPKPKPDSDTGQDP